MEIGVLVVIAFLFIYGRVLGFRSNQAKKRTWEVYQAAPCQLALDPYNPSLRMAALARGREYCKALESYDASKTYPEEAIRNDIEAVSIGRRSA